MTKVTILGAGNFGFALTYHLDRKNDPTLDLHLYARNSELIDHLRHTHSHPKFYPTIELSPRVTATSDLAAAVDNCDVLILAVASTGLRPVLAELKPLLTRPVAIVSIIKALDQHTGQVLSHTIRQELSTQPHTIAAFAGGTTGNGLVSEQYLGGTLACENPDALEPLRALFASPFLRIQTSTDLTGVQYAGSLKNLISVIVGLVKGLGFAYGTQTHALSLAASECERYAVSHGAHASTFTFASQCWGNDMVMSATDPDTRNHQLGLLLGEGLRFSTAVERLRGESKTAEAANTLTTLAPLSSELESYPLLHFLVQLAGEQVGANEIVKLIETYP